MLAASPLLLSRQSGDADHRSLVWLIVARTEVVMNNCVGCDDFYVGYRNPYVNYGARQGRFRRHEGHGQWPHHRHDFDQQGMQQGMGMQQPDDQQAPLPVPQGDGHDESLIRQLLEQQRLMQSELAALVPADHVTGRGGGGGGGHGGGGHGGGGWGGHGGFGHGWGGGGWGGGGGWWGGWPWGWNDWGWPGTWGGYPGVWGTGPWYANYPFNPYYGYPTLPYWVY